MIQRIALFDRVHEDPALKSPLRLKMKINSYSTMPLIFSVVLFWSVETSAVEPYQNPSTKYNKLTREEQNVIPEKSDANKNGQDASDVSPRSRKSGSESTNIF